MSMYIGNSVYTLCIDKGSCINHILVDQGRSSACGQNTRSSSHENPQPVQSAHLL